MARRHARLFLGGDLMTGRGVDQIQKHPSDPKIYESYVRDARDYVALAEDQNGPVPRAVEPSYIWGEALAELTRRHVDTRIVNLETSVTSHDVYWPGKGIQYRMHPENVGCLTTARIDVCALANNHVCDWERTGLIETVTTLRRAGIGVTGAGRDIAEASAPAVAALSGGGRVIVLSLGTESSGIPAAWAAGPQRSGVNFVKLDDPTASTIVAELRDMRQPGDLVVVSIHWGTNWGFDVPEQHVRFAHRLVDGGVDVVHGHSSHHPRPIEVYGGKLVIYGCGELIDDYEGISGYEMFRGDLVLLYVATLTVDDGKLSDLQMVPMQIRRLQLVRASPQDTRWLADTLERACRGFGVNIELDDDGDLVLR